MQRIFLLQGKVQHYRWGGDQFIPQLLGVDNNEQKPFAEYWMGSHPAHSSIVTTGDTQIELTELIKDHGDYILGRKTSNRWGSLPYLFKILDVREMLSIQVHPSKEEAVKGYKKEEEYGIAISAFNRNYKDENSKPEMMVALSDFWLLHGFKPEASLNALLASTPELYFLQSHLADGGYTGLFSYIMQMDQATVNDHLSGLAKRILPLYEQHLLPKTWEDFWAARAIQSFCTADHYDRGIFCIYLFNLIQLKKGQGIFQPAGMPHAYLEGQNVEVMANSDNVLRAGLTDKYIDVPELLKHTVCTPTIPKILEESSEPETNYPSGADEFALHKYNLEAGRLSFTTESAEILMLMEGDVIIAVDETPLFLKKGQSALVVAETQVTIKTDGTALVFRARAGRV